MIFKNKGDHDPYAALRIRDYRLFITARLFLTLGIQIQSVIVGLQVYEYTKDPLWLGLIGLSEAIPFLSTALFAGHVADIVSRKKIILIAASVMILCTAALTFYSMHARELAPEYGIAPVYGIIFITGIARAFLGPSVFAFVSQLIPRELYSNASTWSSTAWHIGAVGGPALAGLLYAGYHAIQGRTQFDAFTLTYATDLGFMITALLFFMMVPARPIPSREKKEPLLTSIGEGLRFVFSNQVVLGALSLDLFAVFFGGAVALLPIFADQVLKVGPEGLGLLRAAPAAGALIMATIMTYYPPFRNAGRNLLLSVAAFGLCIILFGISQNFYLSLAVLALSGAFDNVSVIIRHTILQLMTPDHMRGRVSAVNSIFIGSSNEIGEFESGAAARLLGLVPSVIFGGGVTILVVILTGRFAPRLKELDLEKEK